MRVYTETTVLTRTRVETQGPYQIQKAKEDMEKLLKGGTVQLGDTIRLVRISEDDGKEYFAISKLDDNGKVVWTSHVFDENADRKIDDDWFFGLVGGITNDEGGPRPSSA